MSLIYALVYSCALNYSLTVLLSITSVTDAREKEVSSVKLFGCSSVVPH